MLVRDLRILLRPYYRTRPQTWTTQGLYAIDSRSYVSRHWRYVFLRIPKAGNSTVVESLIQRFPEPHLAGVTGGKVKTRIGHFSDLSRSDLVDLDLYFFFTVVRNPYHRALSAYLDKFKEKHRYRARYGARVARFDGDRVTFPGFCRYLQHGGETENAHWMRQCRLVSNSPRIDFVGRLETLDADIDAIAAHIAGETGKARLVQRAGHATGASARAQEMYDDECRHLIEQVYAEDFARFGYSRGVL